MRVGVLCPGALGKAQNVFERGGGVPPTTKGFFINWREFGGPPCLEEKEFLFLRLHLFLLSPHQIRGQEKLPIGKVKIEIETRYVEPRPAGPLKVTMTAAGKIVAKAWSRSARR